MIVYRTSGGIVHEYRPEGKPTMIWNCPCGKRMTRFFVVLFHCWRCPVYRQKDAEWMERRRAAEIRWKKKTGETTTTPDGTQWTNSGRLESPIHPARTYDIYVAGAGCPECGAKPGEPCKPAKIQLKEAKIVDGNLILPYPPGWQNKLPGGQIVDLVAESQHTCTPTDHDLCPACEYNKNVARKEERVRKLEDI